MSQDKEGENGGKHRIRGIISWGGGIVAAVVIAILVDASTPLGDQIRNILFPPPEVIPPETNIISVIDGDNKNLNEGGSTYSTYVQFMFNGTDDKEVSSFMCSLQDQEFVPCTSPEPKGGLNPGHNVFKVKAIDSDKAEDLTPDVFTLYVLTSAVVEGSIYQEADRPAPSSKVELNKTQYDWTDPIGRFLFQRVPQGFYEYWVYDSSNNPLAGPLKLFIAEGELKKILEPLVLDRIQPEFQQGSAGNNSDILPPPSPSAIQPEDSPRPETKPGGFSEDSLSANMTGSQVDKCTGGDEVCLTHEAAVFVRDPSIYNITVWLNGPQETLSDIDKVTYHLHPTFQPQVVTRYSAEDRFSLSLTAWGQFTLGAEVLFKNGDKMFLPRFISFT